MELPMGTEEVSKKDGAAGRLALAERHRRRTACPGDHKICTFQVFFAGDNESARRWIWARTTRSAKARARREVPRPLFFAGRNGGRRRGKGGRRGTILSAMVVGAFCCPSPGIGVIVFRSVCEVLCTHADITPAFCRERDNKMWRTF